MNDLKVKLQGYMTWSVGKPNSAPRISSNEPVKNLIVNSGLNALGTNTVTSMTATCRVGTGATESSPGMTDLVSRHGVGVNAGTSTSTNSGGSPWWHQFTGSFTFPADTVQGVPLTEIGFFNSLNVMFSRVLFRDSNGDPVSITILSGEILTLEYSVRLYVPTGDVTGDFTVDGDTYNYTIRPSTAGSWAASSNVYPSSSSWFTYGSDILGTEEGSPNTSGGSDSVSTPSSTYQSGSYQRSYNLSLSLTSSNFVGGIGSMRTGISNRFQMSFSPKLPKDNTKVLNFQNFFTVSWAPGEP